MINPQPEREIGRMPIRPVVRSYTKAVKDGHTTIVFSTSMTKGIRLREFNSWYENGTARFRRFHGAHARHIKHYLSTHMEGVTPENVIILAGGNDLPTKKDNPRPVEEIGLGNSRHG